MAPSVTQAIATTTSDENRAKTTASSTTTRPATLKAAVFWLRTRPPPMAMSTDAMVERAPASTQLSELTWLTRTPRVSARERLSATARIARPEAWKRRKSATPQATTTTAITVRKSVKWK